MLVDATTVSDLEVFQDADNRGGLLGLIDHTDTHVGHVALRRRLEQPHSDASSIVEVQKAVAFFADHPAVLAVTDDALEKLQRYLDSNVVLSRSGVRTLSADPRVRFHYFDGRLVSGRAEYSYSLHEGVSDRRLGLQLFDQARIPELIARIGGA